VAQTSKQHYLDGSANYSNNNYDVIQNTYNFDNQPATTSRSHILAGSTAVTVNNSFAYDHVGRRMQNYESITGTATISLSQNSYNEIGQLQTKNLHSTGGSFFQSIGYTYNERGWLLTSSAPLFAMQLYYNTGTNKQYNGNIMYQYFGTPGSLSNNYSYNYDKLNRLTGGTSVDNNNETGITYDLMGNIMALNRYQSGTLIDQLGYTYSSTNQLQSIADASGSNTGLVNGTTTYSYDANGNLQSNANTVNTTQNKSFTYNLLNLPMVATVSTGTASYTYNAAGEKLRKVSVINGVTTTTEYISGIQYKNSTTAVDFIQTEEGKAINNSGTYDYNYYLGDNLGNTRVTFGTKTGAAVLYQQDDYYPFGLEISRSVSSPKNEYLYNKKELQEEFTEYDYGVRFYDPVIGRWTTIDPKAEISRRFSPYTYGDDNSIRNIDPDGQETQDGNDDPPGSHGKIIQPTNAGYRLIHPDLAAIHDVAYNTLDFFGIVDLVNSIGDVGDKSVSTKDKVGHIVQAAAGVITLGEDGEGVEGGGKYSGLKEPKIVGDGLKTTPAQRGRILESNKAANGGTLKSDISGKSLDHPVQAKKGVKANMNQAEVDHVRAKAKGGSNSNKNLQVVSKEENLRKKDN
jgi:RHS repeat-associated protein